MRRWGRKDSVERKLERTSGDGSARRRQEVFGRVNRDSCLEAEVPDSVDRCYHVWTSDLGSYFSLVGEEVNFVRWMGCSSG